MRTDAMNALRDAARNLGRDGAVFSNAMLYQALGAGPEDTPERDRIRKRCSMLIRSGELTRVGRGQYCYNRDAAPARSGELITRMWRAMTSASTGFAVQDIARISGACLSHASKYITFLVDEGYLRRHGKRGQSRLYRGTATMRETVRAPMPPRTLRDPFEDERRRMHELLGIFLLQDMNKPAVQKRIVDHCRAIEARFVNQNEKNEEDA